MLGFGPFFLCRGVTASTTKKVPGWHKGMLFYIGQSDLSMFYRNSLLSPFIDRVRAGFVQ